jgi:Ca2+-transporting ATPase
MITGDHKLTAKAIAKQLGIITSEEDLMSGTKLAALSERVFRYSGTYSRLCVNPEKIKNYKSTASKRPFVAMTGDGVNDAPPLKALTSGLLWELMGQPFPKRRPTWFYLMIIFYHFDCWMVEYLIIF